MTLQERIHKALAKRQEEGLLRQLPTPISPNQVDFCSNDYLGYARFRFPLDTELSEGATGSRLISGNSIVAEQLEQTVAAYHQGESALLFTSGYSANLGLLAALCQRKDIIIYDQLLHASLRDGIVLTRSNSLGFRHNDLADLEQKLQKGQAKTNGKLFVVVESVYSMDGDEAPLTAITALAEQYGANLLVDEAHGTGVLGKLGEGGVVAQGLSKRVFARVHTFGKAIGSHGAVVVGSAVLREYLINFARPFIYSTGLPDRSLARIHHAYRQMEKGIELQRLRELVGYFKAHCPTSVSSNLIPSQTPIQAILCPGNKAVQQLAKVLQKNRIQVLPIRYPTVPQGEERLRICLHAFNTKTEIDQLFTVLDRALS